MFQGFEWYVPADGGHWQRLIGALPKLKAIGISNMWIPPACKGDNQNFGNGYDIVCSIPAISANIALGNYFYDVLPKS